MFKRNFKEIYILNILKTGYLKIITLNNKKKIVLY